MRTIQMYRSVPYSLLVSPCGIKRHELGLGLGLGLGLRLGLGSHLVVGDAFEPTVAGKARPFGTAKSELSALATHNHRHLQRGRRGVVGR